LNQKHQFVQYGTIVRPLFPTSFNQSSQLTPCTFFAAAALLGKNEQNFFDWQFLPESRIGLGQ
jgi:hypothetical protein